MRRQRQEFFGSALFFFSNEPLVSWKTGQGGRSHDADDVIVVMGMAQQAEPWGGEGGGGGVEGSWATLDSVGLHERLPASVRRCWPLRGVLAA